MNTHKKNMCHGLLISELGVNWLAQALTTLTQICIVSGKNLRRRDLQNTSFELSFQQSSTYFYSETKFCNVHYHSILEQVKCTEHA